MSSAPIDSPAKASPTSSAPPHRGLTSAEVAASLAKHGANVLTPPPRQPWWKLYLEKYEDPVVRILIIAAVIAIGVGIVDGKFVEGIGIIIAILLATTLAFLNEFKAKQEFDILNLSSDGVEVKAVRDGAMTTVARKDLVVGDAILVEVGEEVPADGRVIEAVSFQISEARLTGEPRPIDKFATGHTPTKARPEETYPSDHVLRGTIVADGYGWLEVTAVGDSTELGKTARDSLEENDEETPLRKQLETFADLIGVVGLGVAALTFFALVIRGAMLSELVLNGQQWFFSAIAGIAIASALVRVWLPIAFNGFELAGFEVSRPKWLEAEGPMPWVQALVAGIVVLAAGAGTGRGMGWLPPSFGDWMPVEAAHEFLSFFMIAVTIIVVAVPEGLAMSVTLSLAYSMRKMTASNNLVRHMDACETIGAATVICSDKTGTLTQNEMRVFEFEIAGAPIKTLTKKDAFLERLLVEAICANSTAHLSRTPGESHRVLGNPTDGALLLWLDEQKIDYIAERNGFALETQWTFTTQRKMMGTLGRSTVTNSNLLHIKGAPELILDACDRVATADGPRPLGGEADALRTSLKSYQARGMRTLGFAYHDAPGQAADDGLEKLTHNLVWLGFAAISDPIRPEVPGAIQACRKAGVKVKIITGDNSDTGTEIARQIGLWDQNDTARHHHLTGREFADLDEVAAGSVAREVKVLSRARPADKLRLVRLLKEQGEVVAVTGDGVNDGPALNYADVGLAMGKTGTAVAKEASDIILLDDSFNSIVNAIMWGRSLYQNIQRFIVFQLTINVAALALAFLGPFIGIKLPLTVMQMLWINLIMDTFAALALATEPPHWKVMESPPRDPKAFILTGEMNRNILITAGIFVVALLGLVLSLQSRGDLPDTNDPTWGGTILFTVFVLLQFWNLFNARCLGRGQSAFVGLFANRAFLLIAIAIFIGQVLIVNFGGQVFRTVPLSLTDWLWIVGGTSAVLWIGEIVRIVTAKIAR